MQICQAKLSNKEIKICQIKLPIKDKQNSYVFLIESQANMSLIIILIIIIVIKVLYCQMVTDQDLSVFMSFVSRCVFNMVPDTHELAHEDNIIAQIEGYCEADVLICEEFYCHATLEGSKKKDVILSSKVRALFVHPCLEFSKRKLYFRTDVPPETKPKVATGKTIKNN